MTAFALRLANGQDTATRMRFGDMLPLAPAGPLTARNGLRPDGGGEVTVVEGTMSLQVTKFAAWVDGGTSDAQGGYPFVLDADVQLTVQPGDAASSRVDTVVAMVQDDAYDSSGQTSAQVVVLMGTPGAGTGPALPASCVPLRDVVVPAGVSAGTGGLSASNLGADRRTYTTGLGGVRAVASAADRDALPAVQGTVVYRMDTNNLQAFDGTGWQTYEPGSPIIEAVTWGVATWTWGTGGGANGGTTHHLGQTPDVVLVTGQDESCSYTVNNVNSTGFTVHANNLSDGGNAIGKTTAIFWVAIKFRDSGYITTQTDT